MAGPIFRTWGDGRLIRRRDRFSWFQRDTRCFQNTGCLGLNSSVVKTATIKMRKELHRFSPRVKILPWGKVSADLRQCLRSVVGWEKGRGIVGACIPSPRCLRSAPLCRVQDDWVPQGSGRGKRAPTMPRSANHTSGISPMGWGSVPGFCRFRPRY